MLAGIGTAVADLVGRSDCRTEQVRDGKELCLFSTYDIRDIARIVNTLNKGIAVTLTVYGRGRHGETESESDCAVVVPAGRSIATLTAANTTQVFFLVFATDCADASFCARWMHVLGCLSRSTLSFCVAARCLGVSTDPVGARHFGRCASGHMVPK